jgi:TolB-like protein
MGSVWIARHQSLDRDVAVKFIASELVTRSAAATKRFQREARLCAKVENPHVVQIFDQGLTDDGIPYIVMELLKGESLEERLVRDGTLEPAQVALVVAQTAEALAAAHEIGVIHRDIKPANLFLVKSGYDLFIKVVDFGISKRTGDLSGPTLTQAGALVGTPAYMSPEQLVDLVVDERADTWALAVVAYEALTGALPFEGRSPAALGMAMKSGQFPLPSERRPELQPGFDDWFRTAFQVEPDRRHASLSEAATRFKTSMQTSVAPRVDVMAPTVDSGRGVVQVDALRATSLPIPELPSIAVLPFESIRAGADAEAFGDGVTEDIITDLAGVSGLFVIGRRTAFRFKNKTSPAKQVARELGVRFVLTGSVRAAAGHVRISAQLVDADADNQVWAERYDRTLDDIFAVQSEVSTKVVGALELVLTPDEQERLGHRATNNKEAYELFRTARRSYAPPTLTRLNRARELFERVIELDPEFGGGHAGVAMMLMLRLMNGNSPAPPADIATAAQHAERAAMSDPMFAWGQMALGIVRWRQGRSEEGMAALRRAVDIQPSDPDAHAFLGLYLSFEGALDEAIEHIEKAIRLDPNYLGPYLNLLGFTYMAAGRYAEAVTAFKTNDDRGGPIDTPALVPWVVAHQELGQPEEAAAIKKRLLDVLPHSSIGPRALLPNYRDPSIVSRLREAYDRAGIPE